MSEWHLSQTLSELQETKTPVDKFIEGYTCSQSPDNPGGSQADTLFNKLGPVGGSEQVRGSLPLSHSSDRGLRVARSFCQESNHEERLTDPHGES